MDDSSKPCHVDVEKLRLHELYYAVVPPVNLSLVRHSSEPATEAAVILSQEETIQERVNKFRTKQFGFDTVYHSVADGLRKGRLLNTQATQIISSDLVDLDDLGNSGQGMSAELESMAGEFNQVYEILPVDLDRQISEKFVEIQTVVNENMERAQQRSFKNQERLALYFERQYLDAVASLMRWWKHYDELLMMNYQRDATTASNEVQIMVKTYRKQVADRTVTIDFLLQESKNFSDQIRDFDEKKQQEERTAKGLLKRKGRELDKLSHGVEKFLLTTQLLRAERQTLEESLQSKTNAIQNLTLQLKALTAALQKQEASQHDSLYKARDKLAGEKRILSELSAQCDKLEAVASQPVPEGDQEKAKQNSLQDQIEQARRDQVSYGQQLQIIQQELTGIDRMYERRFQVLQQISFKLRNETYVRRLLERKFYRTANFMNLSTLTGKSKLEDYGLADSPVQDAELGGFGDADAGSESSWLEGLYSSTDVLNSFEPAAEEVKAGNLLGPKKASARDEEPDGWW